MPTIEYEYHETTLPVGAYALDPCERPYPAREAGIGWEFVEEVQLGGLVVFRWRRPMRPSPPAKPQRHV